MSKKEKCEDYLGNKFDSFKTMCQYYHINDTTVKHRIENMGMSLKDALTTDVGFLRGINNSKKCVDHLGHQFDSYRKLCEYHNIEYSVFIDRINNGWSIENAILTPKNYSPKIKDHLGNEYDSFALMCAYYKQNPHTVYDRIHYKNWSLEKALTFSFACMDHLGNTFSSFSKMCEYHKVNRRVAWRRIYEEGMTLEEAFTKTIKTHHKSCKDHLGNEYSSISEMCRCYSLEFSTFVRRLKSGMSLEMALTVPVIKIDAIDHLGNKFKSFTTMCQYYEKSPTTVKNRLEHGWDIGRALTTSVSVTNCGKKSYDHLGNEYDSFKEMCEKHKLSASTVTSRLMLNWSLEEALTIPKNMYIGEYRVTECLKRLNIEFYHDRSIKTIFNNLGISVDWNEFLKELQSKLGKAGYVWSIKKIQRLRPDFVLYTDEKNKIRGVIEFDGEQHQNFVEFFFKTIEEFYRRINTDCVKQSFWEYMNIPMLRIRHDQVNMIDNMVCDFIGNPNKYIHNHNTYLSEEEYWSVLTEQKHRINLAFA